MKVIKAQANEIEILRGKSATLWHLYQTFQLCIYCHDLRFLIFGPNGECHWASNDIFLCSFLINFPVVVCFRNVWKPINTTATKKLINVC